MFWELALNCLKDSPVFLLSDLPQLLFSAAYIDELPRNTLALPFKVLLYAVFQRPVGLARTSRPDKEVVKAVVRQRTHNVPVVL